MQEKLRGYIIFLLFMVIGISSCLNIVASNNKQAEGEVKMLKVYLTDEAPVLDGNINEKAWVNATPTGLFQLYKSGAKPHNDTKAWVMYDINNIYIFFECKDRDIKSIPAGRPQDIIDENIWTNEEVEIFIDPGKTRKEFFQLCANMLGTQFDNASIIGEDWHGERDKPKHGWQVATKKDASAWYAEFKIPFRSLRRSSEFIGTPQPGEEWGFNLYRHEIRENEFICWQVVDRGFANSKDFGTIKFLGHKEQKTPIVSSISVSELIYGENAIALEVENQTGKSANITAVKELRNLAINTVSQNKSATVKIENGKTGTLSLPFAITNSGDYELKLTVAYDEGVIFQGIEHRYLKDYKKILQNYLLLLKENKNKVTTSAYPRKVKSALSRTISVFSNKVGRLAKSYADAVKSSDTGSVALSDLFTDIERIEVEGKELKKIFKYMESYDQTEKFKNGLTNALCNSYVPIFPDSLIVNDDSAASLVVMKGETRSFQIALSSNWQAINDIGITVSDLKSQSGGVISSDNYELYRLAYRKSFKNVMETEDTREWFPDALLKMEDFTIPPYSTRGVWVDLKSPVSAKAGNYTGALTIKTGNQLYKVIPVKLTVLDKMLPNVCKLRNDFWINASDHKFGQWYDISDDNIKMLMQSASKNRISAMPSFWFPIFKELIIYKIGDNKFEFDFSKVNQKIKLAKEYGINSFNPDFNCWGGWKNYIKGHFFGGCRVIDKETGKTFMYSTPKALLKDTWADPMFEQFWKAYVKNLKELKLLHIAYYECVDEPNTMERIQLLEYRYGLLKSWVPELKLISWGCQPKGHFKKAKPYISQWSPQLHWYMGVRSEMLKDEKELNIEQAIYTCSFGKKNKQGEPTPSGDIRETNMIQRIVPWMAWKWGIKSYLHYAFNAWGKKSSVIRTEMVDFPTAIQFAKNPQWALVLPASDKSYIIETTRLKAYRDGFQDYDYMYMLNEAVKKLKKTGKNVELVKQATDILSIDDSIIKDTNSYTKNAVVLDNRRIKIGRLLEKIKKILEPNNGS